MGFPLDLHLLPGLNHSKTPGIAAFEPGPPLECLIFQHFWLQDEGFPRNGLPRPQKPFFCSSE
eukprot:2547133-Amphidinium_carterae.1